MGAVSASLLYTRFILGYVNTDFAVFLVVFSVLAAGILFPLFWTTVKHYRATKGDLAGRGLLNFILFSALIAVGMGVLSNSGFFGNYIAGLILVVVGFTAVIYLRKLRARV